MIFSPKDKVINWVGLLINIVIMIFLGMSFYRWLGV